VTFVGRGGGFLTKGALSQLFNTTYKSHSIFIQTVDLLLLQDALVYSYYQVLGLLTPDSSQVPLLYACTRDKTKQFREGSSQQVIVGGLNTTNSSHSIVCE